MEHERLFDYPFDFAEYIEKRLREFEDLEERKFAKTVLQDGLLNIIKETEKKYTALENRVFNEVVKGDGKYGIRMTIVRRGEYDPVNLTWFPMLAAGGPREIGDLPQAVSTVYVRAAEEICRELDGKRRLFGGAIVTGGAAVPAKFSLRRSRRHREKIAWLYRLFTANHVPWRTLNTAYADKMFEVVLEEIDGSLPENAVIEDVRLDGGEYAPYLEKEMTVLWNIEEVHYQSSEFPIACLDSVNYEHVFPLEKFGAENGFLLEKTEDISEIRFDADAIKVITSKETFHHWTAHKIISQDPQSSLGYVFPVLTNNKKVSFTRSYLDENGVRLATRADLTRRINELDIDAFLEFTGFEILPNSALQNDDMNFFMQDEVFDRQVSRVLLLKFKAKDPAQYLNDAVVRYVVSDVQLFQAEYRCVGRLE